MNTESIVNIVSAGIGCLVCLWNTVSQPFKDCLKKTQENAVRPVVVDEKKL